MSQKILQQQNLVYHQNFNLFQDISDNTWYSRVGTTNNYNPVPNPAMNNGGTAVVQTADPHTLQVLNSFKQDPSRIGTLIGMWLNDEQLNQVFTNHVISIINYNDENKKLYGVGNYEQKKTKIKKPKTINEESEEMEVSEDE